jgi:hypothetical protein
LTGDVLSIQAVVERYLTGGTQIEQNRELALIVGLGLVDLLAGVVDRTEVRSRQIIDDPASQAKIAEACLLLAAAFRAMSAFENALKYAQRAHAIYTTINPSKLAEVDTFIQAVNQQVSEVFPPKID